MRPFWSLKPAAPTKKCSQKGKREDYWLRPRPLGRLRVMRWIAGSHHSGGACG